MSVSANYGEYNVNNLSPVFSEFGTEQKYFIPVKTEEKPDEVSLSSKNVGIKVKTKKQGKTENGVWFSHTGTLNNKNYAVTEEVQTKGLKTSKYKNTVAGLIGDKQINFTTEKIKAGKANEELYGTKKSVIVSKGNYNGKDFDLVLTQKGFLSFATKGVLKGKIGDKEVEYKFPGSPVSEDETERDIISSVLEANNYTIKSNKKGCYKKLNVPFGKILKTAILVYLIAAAVGTVGGFATGFLSILLKK